MLPKKIRLTKRGSFSYVYRKGTAISTSSLRMLFVVSNAAKIGFSVSKKVGNAVVRNLVRRRLRAAVRDNLHLLKRQGQIVFVAKEGIEKMEYAMIEKDVKYLLDKVIKRDSSL